MSILLDALPMPRRAYSYSRISDKAQAKGDGLQRQAEFATQLCREQGWCLDDTFVLVDRGVSAFHGDNASTGALAQFLRAVTSGRVTPGSVLIVENIDRLSREEVDEAYDLFRRIIKAGVWIATREPRRIYNRETAGNMLNLLEPLFIMARGHEESKMKSMRIGDAWQRNKQRARETKVPITERCPAWMRWTPQGYVLNPQHAKTLRTIFHLAQQGLGSTRIILHLQQHPAEHPPFEGNTAWNKTYVTHLLRTRQTLGEYQPRKGRNGRSMVPDGDPIPGFYPAVITPEEWERTQALRAGRKHRTGRPGRREANLFTGIVCEARSRRAMSVRASQRSSPRGLRRYPYLVAKETRWGNGFGFAYQPFEDAMLDTIRELRPRDILPATAEVDERESRINELTGRVVVLDHRAEILKQKLADPEQDAGQDDAVVSALLDSLKRVKADKAGCLKELQALKLESLTGRGETLAEAQTLVELLRAARGKPEEEGLRQRLKAALRWLLEEVWVLVQPTPGRKQIIHAQIYLRGGRRKPVLILPPNAPPGLAALAWGDLADCDFRAGDIGRVAGDAEAAAEFIG
jgi:DNA invertase Pin-like site-specific DNA recombinase